jgi:hypothetical protein
MSYFCDIYDVIKDICIDCIFCKTYEKSKKYKKRDKSTQTEIPQIEYIEPGSSQSDLLLE